MAAFMAAFARWVGAPQTKEELEQKIDILEGLEIAKLIAVTTTVASVGLMFFSLACMTSGFLGFLVGFVLLVPSSICCLASRDIYVILNNLSNEVERNCQKFIRVFAARQPNIRIEELAFLRQVFIWIKESTEGTWILTPPLFSIISRMAETEMY